MAIPYVLDFEKPVVELEKRIQEAEAALAAGAGAAVAVDEPEGVQPDVPVKPGSGAAAKKAKPAASKVGADPAAALAELKATHARELTRVYSDLTAWQTVRVARPAPPAVPGLCLDAVQGLL